MGTFEFIVFTSIMVAAIILIRTVLKNYLPKRLFMLLWIIALVRMLVPISIPSQLSIYNLFGSFVPSEAINIPVTNTGVSTSANSITFSSILVIWIAGIAALAIFFVAVYVKSTKAMKSTGAVPCLDLDRLFPEKKINIRICTGNSINSPLVYGAVRPIIFIPTKIYNNNTDTELRYIITHELTHIKHLDPILKLLFTALLCLYWFNPLVWIMYLLVNRDMELSCDESVVSALGDKVKYASILLNLSGNRQSNNTLFANFSAARTKERIVSIMKNKKKSILIIIACVAVLATFTTAFAFNSATPEIPSTTKTTNENTSMTKAADKSEIKAAAPAAAPKPSAAVEVKKTAPPSNFPKVATAATTVDSDDSAKIKPPSTEKPTKKDSFGASGVAPYNPPSNDDPQPAPAPSSGEDPVPESMDGSVNAEDLTNHEPPTAPAPDAPPEAPPVDEPVSDAVVPSE